MGKDINGPSECLRYILDDTWRRIHTFLRLLEYKPTTQVAQGMVAQTDFFEFILARYCVCEGVVEEGELTQSDLTIADEMMMLLRDGITRIVEECPTKTIQKILRQYVEIGGSTEEFGANMKLKIADRVAIRQSLFPGWWRFEFLC